MITEQFIYYRGLSLDRASEQRKDKSWMEQQWRHPECRVLLLKRDHNLMHWPRELQQPPVAIRHARETIEPLISFDETCVFLGLDEGAPLYAADVSGCDPGQLGEVIGEHEFVDLREAGCLLSAQEAAQLAYARGLLYWNRHSGFCSSCGSPATSEHSGHVRRCSNPDCERVSFPRTDPAVIMLVEHKPRRGPARCLLARNSRFASGMMSTLAGFVDPGESLEDTVAREVMEEAGVMVDQVVYQASQPWPFPGSIMLGFRANAVTTEICVDGVEIAEANWFSAAQLKDFGEWGDGSKGYCLPRKDSIARFLINSWIEEQ